MEPDNSLRKSMKKNEKDTVIGRALTRAIKESAISEECPSPEDLSAFIEGKLDEQQRDKVIGHLSHCDRCYEVFLTAQEMIKEEKEEAAAKVMVKKKSWYYAPIAIAAAAVLVIVIKFVLQLPSEYVPLSSNQIMGRLAKNTDMKTLTKTIKEGWAPSYGFTGAVPLEKASFSIGISLTDLEVSLAAEDKANSLDLIKRINSIFQNIEGSGDIVSFYGDISKKLEEGVSPRDFSGKSQKVESFFKNKNALLYLRFGEWVEGGRLAAFSKDKEFFDSKSIQYFINNLEDKNLPQGIFTSLNEIKEHLAKDTILDGDFKKIEIAFTSIIEMV
jgi:hypothetical protein